MKDRKILRRGLKTFGFLSFVGSVADGLILVFVMALVARGEVSLDISVWAHIEDHLPMLTWLRPVAEWLLQNDLVDWLFGLKAVVYFPIRIIFSVVTGAWALKAARRLEVVTNQSGD